MLSPVARQGRIDVLIIKRSKHVRDDVIGHQKALWVTQAHNARAQTACIMRVAVNLAGTCGGRTRPKLRLMLRTRLRLKVCDPLRRRASARGLRWRLSARTPTPGPAHGGPLVRGTPSNHLCEAGAHVRRQGGRGGRGARGAELGSHSRQIQAVGEPQAQHHMVEQLLMRAVRRLLAACRPRRAPHPPSPLAVHGCMAPRGLLTKTGSWEDGRASPHEPQAWQALHVSSRRLQRCMSATAETALLTA